MRLVGQSATPLQEIPPRPGGDERKPNRYYGSRPALPSFRGLLPQADQAAMSQDPSFASRNVEITNELGLHLRPATEFVKLASKFQSEIRIRHNGMEINGKSILDLTLLAAESGTKFDLEASGPDAEAAVDALALLVLSEFKNGQDTAEREPSA
jgi:phosphocarrier protein HPr